MSVNPFQSMYKSSACTDSLHTNATRESAFLHRQASTCTSYVVKRDNNKAQCQCHGPSVLF